MIWIKVLLCLISCSICLSQNIGFDCASDSSNYTTISLIEIGECEFKDEDITETDTEIQLLQTRDSTYVDTYSCLINLQYTIQNCGMHSHNSLVKGGIVSENYVVSSEECLIMHKLRRARVYGQEYQIRKFNETSTRWITLAGGISYDGTCTGGRFNNKWGSYDKVVAHGQLTMLFSTGIAVRILKENSIRLPSGIICPIDTIECLDPTYGRVFWKVSEIFPCSEDAYHVVYQGPAVKVQTLLGYSFNDSRRFNTMFSVKESEQLFTLSTVGKRQICRYDVYQTEHPQYMILESRKGLYPFKKEAIPTVDLDFFMYLNAKIIHVTRGIEMSMRIMYKTLSLEMCELERGHLKTLTTLAFISPVAFAFQYMNAPGYTAISSGEVIHIIKCHPVPISPRKDDDCTIEHPVYYLNESYYVTPRSHLLQRTATPTPCSSILTPEYKIAGKWYSFRNGMMPTSSPRILSPKIPSTWEGLDLGNIMNAGVYTSEQLDNVRHQIMYPQERKAINEIVTGALNGDSISHSNIDYGILINKDLLKSQFHIWWLETWGWFKWLGEFGSIFFSLYLIYTIFKYICVALFRLKALHELFGCSLILITSLVDGLADYILHRNSHRFENVKNQKDINERNSHELKTILHEENRDHHSNERDVFKDIPNAPFLEKHY